MTTLTFHEALEQAELLARQAFDATQSHRISCAMSLIRDGKVVQLDDGTWQVHSETTEGKAYTVNGVCGCEDSHYRAPRGLCKHRLAVYLSRRTLQLMHADDTPAPAPEPTPAPSIPAQFFTTIQNKPFVRFEGLLHVAHERGLMELNTTTVHITSDLVICQAVVKMRDGSVFTDIGDATPQNVKAHLKPHWIRIAATRATARALRRALNIDACSVEELGDD